jgi:hypothetical protein
LGDWEYAAVREEEEEEEERAGSREYGLIDRSIDRQRIRGCGPRDERSGVGSAAAAAEGRQRQRQRQRQHSVTGS